MTSTAHRAWPRWTELLYAAPAWLFILFCTHGVPWLGEQVSENVFGLTCTLAGLLVVAPFVAQARGRLRGRWFTWLVVVPCAVLLGATLLFMPD